MTQTSNYKTLFKVKILHRYFLNKGNSDYYAMSESDRLKQSAAYDFTRFFRVIPNSETAKKLEGYNLFFKSLNDGIVVMTKVESDSDDVPFISLDEDLSLTFLIQLIDQNFYHYTNLKLSDAGKLSYFSNRRLDEESDTFPLINKEGDTINIDDSFILSDDSVTTELQSLSVYEADQLFGFVRIYMNADESNLDVIDSEGKIPSTNKVFEILLENRKTFWRYIFNSDQTVVAEDDVEVEGVDSKVLISKATHPLTEKGFISIDLGTVELPNPDVRMIIPDEENDKEYSEIYM